MEKYGLEKCIEGQENEVNREIIDSLGDTRIWKMSFACLDKVVYLRVKDIFVDKFISFYSSKKQILQDVRSLHQYGYAIEDYDFFQLRPSYFISVLSSKANSIPGCLSKLHTRIGSQNNALNMKNRFNQRLIYKMCGLTIRSFCICNFELDLKHVAKIIICGRRCESISFENLHVHFQKFPKNFLNYNHNIDLSIKLKSILFNSCTPRPIESMEASYKIVCTVMRSILDSQLLRTLSIVTFNGLPKENSWRSLNDILAYNNVVVKHCWDSTEVKVKFN
ncbi:unnamed protein product [Moneuplotes crassus]|uniref:Uncharacterized protein n=1 Tax=Euplotes crassus TaxID=5936 RepID=A0AAD2D3F4_EUPCR|nr:unnamed protein product [Moneuplotes crassus]